MIFPVAAPTPLREPAQRGERQKPRPMLPWVYASGDLDPVPHSHANDVGFQSETHKKTGKRCVQRTQKRRRNPVSVHFPCLGFWSSSFIKRLRVGTPFVRCGKLCNETEGRAPTRSQRTRQRLLVSEGCS